MKKIETTRQRRLAITIILFMFLPYLFSSLTAAMSPLQDDEAETQEVVIVEDAMPLVYVVEATPTPTPQPTPEPSPTPTPTTATHKR